jgi:HK97 gp10 family phage protein
MTLASRLPQIANNLRRDVPREVRSVTERTVIPAARARIHDVSGELALSIVAVDHDDGVLIEARAVDAQGRAYGRFVELGTHHASPHPFLIPALEQSRPVIIEAVRAAVAEACR